MVTFKREERFFKCPMGKAKDDAIRGRWMGNDYRQLEKKQVFQSQTVLGHVFLFLPLFYQKFSGCP